MRITVLTVPECPNALVAMERVAAALAGRTARVELIEVEDQAQAERLGMHGSPTILVDGVDLFATHGESPSISCRLYRDGDGAISGAPSQAALSRAFGRGHARGEAAAPTDYRAPDDALDAVGRDGRGRRAPAERGLSAVQQAVLRHFAATGTAPDVTDLENSAADAGRTAGDVLAELAAEDFLTLDQHGCIRAAYPFSATPTRHRVRIAETAEAWSMCAIDALGIPAMLGADVTISSTDPVSGEPVTVTSHAGATRWEPSGAVVFVGRRPGAGPAAEACCDALNFFTGTATARVWIAEHPGIPGRIVDQAQAEQIAAQTFGPLLNP